MRSNWNLGAFPMVSLLLPLENFDEDVNSVLWYSFSLLNFPHFKNGFGNVVCPEKNTSFAEK